MSTPKRYLSGISSVASDNPLGIFPYLDPTKWASKYECWDLYDAAQATTYYTLTQTNGVDSIVAGAGGVLTLTLGGADNDLAQLYGTNAAWATSATKKMFFEAAVTVAKGASGTIGQEELFVGLSSVQAGTNFFNADGTLRTMDDAIGFASFDGSVNIDCIQGEADVFSTETAATVYADATKLVLSWYYDGDGNTKFYKDDALVATLTTSLATSALTPMFYVKDGEGKAKVLSVDYYLVARER